MIRIQASVGRGGLNRADDVRVVQKALNVYRRRYGRGQAMPETGVVASAVVETILDLQRRLGVAPSGRIEPMSPTLRALERAGSPTNIGSQEFQAQRAFAGTIEVLVSDGLLLSSGSQWGHVAIDVGGTVYSRGHGGYFVIPRARYLQSNGKLRETVGLVLQMSESEIRIVLSELRRRVALNEPYDLLGNSCSTNVADVLETVGVLAHDPRYQWDASRRTAVSPKEVLIIVSRSSRVVKRNIYPKTK
jgi:hypothetical protein